MKNGTRLSMYSTALHLRHCSPILTCLTALPPSSFDPSCHSSIHPIFHPFVHPFFLPSFLSIHSFTHLVHLVFPPPNNLEPGKGYLPRMLVLQATASYCTTRRRRVQEMSCRDARTVYMGLGRFKMVCRAMTVLSTVVGLGGGSGRRD